MHKRQVAANTPSGCGHPPPQVPLAYYDVLTVHRPKADQRAPRR